MYLKKSNGSIISLDLSSDFVIYSWAQMLCNIKL